jgi:hypothetical protein
LTSTKQVFPWGGKQQKAFENLKEKINIAPVLALQYLQHSLEIEINVSDYAMGLLLIQGRKLICYHYKTFTSAVRNYPAYDKELYALAQSVKNWKHYLMGKETIVHTNHHPLHFFFFCK